MSRQYMRRLSITPTSTTHHVHICMYVRRSKCVLIQQYIHNTYSNMIFSKNENSVLLVYLSRLPGKRRNNDRNSVFLCLKIALHHAMVLHSYTSKKAVGFFQKSLYIIWDTTLTQRELLCVWNTFDHDPTRFFFHPLRNVITHSLDLSSRERKKTHTLLHTTNVINLQLSNVDILFPMAIYLLPPQNPPSTYPEEALSIEEGEPQMFKRLFRP